MHGLYNELIPPNGVEFATFLNLKPLEKSSSSTSSARILGHLVIARSSSLRIFEVREEPAPLPTLQQVENDTKDEWMRRGTEAVEGEVEMDERGEGFVNMATVKSLPPGTHVTPSTVTKLYHIREHRLQGVVTGLAGVQTTSTADDGMDRLLISFKDAKISLMEWSPYHHDLTTVSLHTYERSPQILSLPPPSSRTVAPYIRTWRSKLRVDPGHRCSLLTLPKDGLAILPFHTHAELDMMDDVDRELGKSTGPLSGGRDIPYQPSFILDLVADVDTKIRNIIDVIFVHGFNNPTIAIAFQERQTWTGRLNEFKDTVSVYIITLDLVTRSYPIITQAENLPYDLLYLVQCPSTASYGGVIAVTPTSILHIDQAGRVVGVAVNGWTSRVSGLALPQGDDESGEPLDLALEGSNAGFANDSTLVIFLANGDVRTVRVILDGRSLSKLEVGSVIGKTSLACCVVPVTDKFIFLGSTAGDSVLLGTSFVDVTVEKTVGPATAQDDGDMELDEDIYGDLKSVDPQENQTGPQVETVSVLRLSLADSLPAHGTIGDICFGVSDPGELDTPSPELVACTGVSHLAGFTRFTKHIPTRTKRLLPAIGGSQGIWSLRVKRSRHRSDAASSRDGSEGGWVIVSTNDGQGQGITRIITRNLSSGGQTKPGVSIESRDLRVSSKPGVTITAGSFFQNTTFVTVIRDGTLRLYDGDFTERIVTQGSASSPRIKAASISDPYIVTLKEDHSVTIHIGDTMTGQIKQDVQHTLPESHFAMLYSDQTGIFEAPVGSGEDGNMEQIEDILDAERGTRWLVLFTLAGNLEIRFLPSFELVFSVGGLSALPFVVAHPTAETSDGMEEDTKAPASSHQTEIQAMSLLSMGESTKKPYLVLITAARLLVIYEIISTYEPPSTRTKGLAIRMVKMFTSVLDSPSNIPLQLVPFNISYGPNDIQISGAFCTGASPFWLVATDKSGLKAYPSAQENVTAISCCGDMFVDGPVSGGSSGVDDFLVCAGNGPSLMQWMGDVELVSELPSRSIPVGRQYTAILFDPPTRHVVAVSSQKSPFRLFDEEGNSLWEPDGPGISDPQCECSSVELISPDTWTTVDGYEFVQNEFVNAAESISLETLSAEKGQKEYVVVGTTIFRGEDLAVKGAVYIFEVIEVVPDPASPKRKHRLRLLCRDEAKGPVTAVCGINGYLISSMGQKIFVRAFDMDERLVGVAFLDVGLYVTSLKTLKNLLLIGDAVKSVWFVCFQEDPFKLVVLGKDQQSLCLSNCSFFFGEGKELAFVTADENGIIRIHEYDPGNPDSMSGQHLLCKTEFDAHAEHRSVLAIARRPEVVPELNDDDVPLEPLVPVIQSVLVFSTLEGAVSLLSPVDQATYRRLSNLQGQLIRNVQHVAGLNPRGFRTVQNDRVSRPLATGILDGSLLASFTSLEVERQVETTKQIATDRETILQDLAALYTSW